MALVEARRRRTASAPGDKLLMVAFGAGYTAGAAVVEWTADPARAVPRTRRADPPRPAAAEPLARARSRERDVRPDRQDGARHRRQPRPRAGDRARLRRPGSRRGHQLPRQRRGGRRGRRRDHGASAGAADHDPGRHRAPAARRARRSSRPPSTGSASVDILVNNAGITRDNLLMRMDAERVGLRHRHEPVRPVLDDARRSPGRWSRPAPAASST